MAALPEDTSPKRLRSAPEHLLSVFAVPLRCPLVDGLGCGIAAKPVLTELEHNPSVAQAWLNHSGTTLVLVWNADTKPETRAQVVAGVSKTAKLEELSGSPRDAVVRDIQSGSGWYRAANVDELSREEAEIVAHRLIDSINAAEPLPKEKSDLLWASFTDTLQRRFIQGDMSNKEVADELFKAALQQVGPKGLEAVEKPIREACCAIPEA